MGGDSLDMVNRDPNGLNASITVAFDEVFGEPESSHSAECAWKCTNTCYNGGKKFCYMILTYLCGWLCGLCWGCEFACLAFDMIYVMTPYLKTMSIVCGTAGKLFQACLDCCCAPICSTCGLVFSQIKVVQSSG